MIAEFQAWLERQKMMQAAWFSSVKIDSAGDTIGKDRWGNTVVLHAFENSTIPEGWFLADEAGHNLTREELESISPKDYGNLKAKGVGDMTA